MSERLEKVYECDVDGRHMELSAREAYFLRIYMGQTVKLHMPAIGVKPIPEGNYKYSEDEEQMFIRTCGGNV